MKKTPQPQFTPEQELLLWSIRVDHTKDQRIAEILSAGVDWNYVRENAIQHGIIPLLYKRLKEEMSDLVPSNELAQLRTLFMANSVRNLQMTQELIKVLDILADNGIDATPFKGSAMAVQVYNDLSMRSFCDLDILINKGDLIRGCEILKKSGYIPIFDNFKLKDEIKLGKELNFSHKNYGLDVHWKFAARFRRININIENILKRRQKISLFNKDYLTFSLEDNLILLSVYCVMDRDLYLKEIADIIILIENHPEIIINNVMNEAKIYNIRRILYIGLNIAQILGGVKLKKEVEVQLRNDTSAEKLAQKKMKILFKTRYDMEGFFQDKINFCKSRDQTIDQFLYICYFIMDILLFPKRSDFKKLKLHKSMYFVYFFIKPFYLLKEFGIQWIIIKIR